MNALIVFCVLMADVPPPPSPISDLEVPAGVNAEKWLAAKARRDAMEAERKQLAYELRQQRHVQQYYDREDRLHNAPYRPHPAMVAQQQMAVLQSTVLSYTFSAMVYGRYPYRYNYQPYNYRPCYRPYQSYSWIGVW